MFRLGVCVAVFTTIVALVLSDSVSNPGQLVGNQDDIIHELRRKRRTNIDRPSPLIDGMVDSVDSIARRSANSLSVDVATGDHGRKRRGGYYKTKHRYYYQGLRENLMEVNRQQVERKRRSGYPYKYSLTDDLLERKRRQAGNKTNLNKEADNAPPNTTEKSSNVIIEEVIFKRKREAPTGDMKRGLPNDVGYSSINPTGFEDDVIRRNERDVARVKTEVEQTTTTKSSFVIEDVVIFRKKRNSADVIEEQILQKNGGENVKTKPVFTIQDDII